MGKLNLLKTERNKKIFALRVEKGLTLQKIANIFRITKVRVQQIILSLDPIKIQEKIEKRKKRYGSLYDYIGDSSITQLTGIKTDGRNRVREFVRIRDNHTCQKCGKTWRKGQRRFDVHHIEEHMEGKSKVGGIIKYDKENIIKMITYCHKCHLNLDSVREKMVIGRGFRL